MSLSGIEYQQLKSLPVKVDVPCTLGEALNIDVLLRAVTPNCSTVAVLSSLG